jgi:hypothetical protein
MSEEGVDPIETPFIPSQDRALCETVLETMSWAAAIVAPFTRLFSQALQDRAIGNLDAVGIQTKNAEWLRNQGKQSK